MKILSYLLLPVVAGFLSRAQAQQLAKVPDWEIVEGGTASGLSAGGKNYVKSVTVARPVASNTAEQLAAINPHLPKLLPRFETIMETAEVSSRYKEIYDLKLRNLKNGSAFTPHNYFDLETALRLEDPVTKRKVLLVQTDMDVVTDGSDPVREPTLAGYDLARSSNWYLPTTSYGWSGKGAANPFLEYYPKAVKELEALRGELQKKAEADKGVIWREMLAACDAQIYRMKMRGMGTSTRKELGARRFLLADRDPFVVLPIPWVKGEGGWVPKIGDYAAVVYKNKVYPAVLGDAGPSDKIGEASLKLARALNPEANGRKRAVEELAVTYLFFPRSRTGFKEPNLAEWQAKVKSLLEEIGGLSDWSAFHDWTAQD